MSGPTSFPLLPTELAIARCVRHMTLARGLRFALLSVTILLPLVAPLLASRRAGLVADLLLWIPPLTVMALWILASIAGIRVSKLVQGAPSLIAAGLLDQAELQLAEGISRFTLVRSSKVLALHHLALLRHAQGRFGDSLRLADAALGHGADRVEESAGVSARLLVADAALEMGDLSRCHAALTSLRRCDLRLSDLLHLTALEIDYLSRIGAWREMLVDVRARIDLCELMPAPVSVRSQALLGLAAREAASTELADFLVRRCVLLADVEELVAQRPPLGRLFGMTSSAEQGSPTTTTPTAPNPIASIPAASTSTGSSSTGLSTTTTTPTASSPTAPNPTQSLPSAGSAGIPPVERER